MDTVALADALALADDEPQLTRHIRALLVLAESVGAAAPESVEHGLAQESAYLNGQLLPHFERVERTLSRAVNRRLADPDVMRRVRQEHEQVRRLIAELDRVRALRPHSADALGPALALRRLLFGLFAVLQVLLGEERLYRRVAGDASSQEAAQAIASSLRQLARQPLWCLDW